MAVGVVVVVVVVALQLPHCEHVMKHFHLLMSWLEALGLEGSSHPSLAVVGGLGPDGCRLRHHFD